MNDSSDHDYREFWTEFRGIVPLLDRGQFPLARQRLEALRLHPRKGDCDPGGQVDYTYAVLLQQAPTEPGDLHESVQLLGAMLDRAVQQRGALDPFVLRVELAAGLILVREFERAATLAAEAVAEGGARPEAALALQNLARAQVELGHLDEARESYLRMLEISLRAKRLAHAGIAAEHLGRIALRRGQAAEAASWHDLAQDAYRTDAPHHLSTLGDLSEALAHSTPRLPLDALPSQARALRAAVPEPSEVGERAGVHLDSLCIDLGVARLLADSEPEESCWIAIPIHIGEPATRQRICELIVGEADSVLLHGWTLAILEELLRELWPAQAEAILAWISAKDGGDWSLEADPNPGMPFQLVWRACAAWPALLGAELRALGALLQAAFLGRRQKLANRALAGVQWINLSDRAWPRPLQTWMILQGQAAAGGTAGPAQIAEDLVRGRLLREQDNLDAFAKLGFSAAESLTLHRGGLIALLPTQLIVPGESPSRDIGTAPLNELSSANLPDGRHTGPDTARPGFVLDREYNTWFFAPSSTNPDQSVYGAKPALFRDHFAPVHAELRISGTLRAKHYAVPVAEIRSPSELFAVRTLLDATAERLQSTGHVAPDTRVWYRGQTRGYLLGRPEPVSRFLFGLPRVDEPSLPGAAPRRGWNYLKVHSLLAVLLQGLIYRNAAHRGESVRATHAKWLDFASAPGRWDLAVMMIAQHYGVPTHGIDITCNLDVALWFATHRLVTLEQRAAYRQLNEADWGREAAAWPVIYAILPVTHSLRGAIVDVDSIAALGLHAPRPQRQSAAFFMGAHGLHRNRLAEALVCALRLAPGSWETRCSYETLFPLEQDDPVYAWILDVKRRFGQGDAGRFLAEVPHYAVDAARMP